MDVQVYSPKNGEVYKIEIEFKPPKKELTSIIEFQVTFIEPKDYIGELFE